MTARPASIYWYDFESFGVDPRRDRAAQFGGVRTDEALNIIDEPLVLYCRPADDFLPSPLSCLTTGISPGKALAEGLPETKFTERLNQEFSRPGTCVSGYNSIRFDDEMTRRLLYRNLFDPYAREWQNGNSRWDLLDAVRLCAAARPEGIEWPRREDGAVTFALEALAAANDIAHEQAHDALADVLATIGLARLIRQKQPRLFDYVYRLRARRRVLQQLDLNARKLVLHVSGRYPALLGCIAPIMPLCEHPQNRNGIIVVDLREDPRPWLELPVEEIRERVFTPAEQLPEGTPRIGLRLVHVNRCPLLAPPGVLSDEQAARYQIDLARCGEHRELLRLDDKTRRKIARVFERDAGPQETDPDYMIYSGSFFSDPDRKLMATVHNTPPAELGRFDLPFQDKRLPEMLFRFRARNYRDTLDSAELQRWNEFRAGRLDAAAIKHYREEFSVAREQADAARLPVLQALQDYVDELLASLPGDVDPAAQQETVADDT